MKIACLSGKGGAGKTMVAVNLAVSAGADAYIDCDVEEPNGRIFLQSDDMVEESVYSLLPEFDANKCVGCKKCVEFCRFHALMYIKEKPMVFAEVCHSCGGCMMVCPHKAITEKPKQVGKIEIGHYGKLKVVSGVLNTGEASGVPVIKEALRQAEGVTIIDCPPGSACSVMESITDADYCILVAEPTAFGFHNFKMVYELACLLNKRCGVVINKQDGEYLELEAYCEEKKIPVLARIPYSAEYGEPMAKGEVLAESNYAIQNVFLHIYTKIGGAL